MYAYNGAGDSGYSNTANVTTGDRSVTPIDVTISLYWSPVGAGRTPYENIIRYFADGVYEMTNGANKLRQVKIYTGGAYANQADIIWKSSQHPCANVSGRSYGGHVYMGDSGAGANFVAGKPAAMAWPTNGAITTMGSMTSTATVNRPVAAGSPVQIPIVVDSTLGELEVEVAYLGAPLSATLTLYDPNYSPTVLTDCESWGEGMDQLTVCFLSVSGPPAGTWTFDIVATDEDIFLVYWVGGSAKDTTLTFDAVVDSLTGDVIEYPEPIVVGASVGKEYPITGAVVTATLQAPDGTIWFFPMRDDGVAPDDVADDGLYAALLDYACHGWRPYHYRVVQQRRWHGRVHGKRLDECARLAVYACRGEL